MNEIKCIWSAFKCPSSGLDYDESHGAREYFSANDLGQVRKILIDRQYFIGII